MQTGGSRPISVTRGSRLRPAGRMVAPGRRSRNDPYDEHDFGSVTVAGHVVFFKIDYFDLDLRNHSPDPSEPAVTRRVMTLMLAEEY
jgi:hypothetical protein